MSLQGKRAVISGASRGIGFACAQQLRKAGADVFLLASDSARLALAKQQLAIQGTGEIGFYAADLRDLKGCEQAVNAYIEQFSSCDIFVHSAGATKGGVFPDQPDEDYLDGFALKFHAGVRLSRLFWPYLKQSKGNIVMINGTAARTPSKGFLVGGAVNSALANFSKGLADQGLEDDINVNWINPGLTQTDRLITLFEKQAKEAGKSIEEIAASRVENEGIRRMGQPEDIAALTVFLCSPAARHIHGTGINVDGGSTRGYF